MCFYLSYKLLLKPPVLIYHWESFVGIWSCTARHMHYIRMHNKTNGKAASYDVSIYLDLLPSYECASVVEHNLSVCF